MNEQQAQAIEREADNIPLQIGFKRLSENAVIPTKAHASDSGYDLFATQDVILAPGDTRIIPTDIAIILPEGYEAIVRPRSGITSKTKLRVQLGTIDNSYTGNIGIIVDNIRDRTGKETIGYHSLYISDAIERSDSMVPYGSYRVRKGDKIAQLVVQQLPQTVAVEITDELDDTSRGANGFGSSGV